MEIKDNLEAADQKEKKAKKKNKDNKANKKTMIISFAVAAVCATLGAFGGMFIYENTHVVPTYVAPNRHSDATIKEKSADILASLKKDTLADDYSSNVADIINYSSWLQATAEYGALVGYSKASSSASTTYVHSATVSTPSEIFYQNISNTNAIMGVKVNTAYRFYDQKDSRILGYEGKTTEDWKNAGDPSNYTYDEYMQKYGKLFKGDYFVTKDTSKDKVKEKYLTDNVEEYEKSTETGKYEVNGIIAYDVSSSTVENEGSSIKKNDDGTYTVDVKLKADKAAVYYKVQMQTTGGLSELPTFSSSELTFTLDSDLYPISSVFKDKYHGKMSIINVDLDMVFYQYYYHSDHVNGFKDKDGREFTLTIPEVHDVEDAYTLGKLHDFSDVEDK